jgi:hypothetical protein
VSEVDKVWNVFSDLMRQFPLWPATFGGCQCGRAHARGCGKCYLCIQEELAAQVGPELAEKATASLQAVADVWNDIRDKVEENHGT